MPPNAPVWPAQTGSTANVIQAKRATGELRLVRKLLFPIQKLRLLAVSATGGQTAMALLLCAREKLKAENGAARVEATASPVAVADGAAVVVVVVLPSSLLSRLCGWRLFRY
jgi:hypothetical protein